MAYQDAWVRGTVRVVGTRECESRYEAIRPFLAAYARQFTLWDIGANLGYFGLRAAHEFGCVSVMVDPRLVLAESVALNRLPTTIAMAHRLSVRDLQELAASEHADVVLALNVLHHFEDWSGALDAVLSLGTEVFIETPGRGDTGSVNYEASQELLDEIEGRACEVVALTPSHVTSWVQRPLFRFARRKLSVSAGYAYRERVRARGPHPVRPHFIHSTYDTATIRFNDGETRQWHPGMNLWNWAQLGGAYPSRATVRAAVERAHAGLTAPHGDFRPWNLILQGDTVAVIDAGHRRSVDDEQGLGETRAWIERPERAYSRGA